jgi:large subunit ribosomal protein L9
MKIILLQDVKALGKKGEIKEVSDGHARNYLIPKKLGAEATAKNLNDLKQQQAAEDKRIKEQLAAAEALGEELSQKQVSLSMKIGEGGKPFGSVSSKEIAQAYKEQHGLDIDKKKLQLSEPIKSFGIHQIPIKLHPQVTATLTVIVKEK